MARSVVSGSSLFVDVLAFCNSATDSRIRGDDNQEVGGLIGSSWDQ